MYMYMYMYTYMCGHIHIVYACSYTICIYSSSCVRAGGGACNSFQIVGDLCGPESQPGALKKNHPKRPDTRAAFDLHGSTPPRHPETPKP